MDEIKIPLNNFDLTGFIGRIVSFESELGTGNPAPLTVIPVVEANGSTPNLYEQAVDRIPHDELVKEGKTLYFPFSSSNTGDPVLCVDGRKHYVPKSEDRERYESSTLTMSPTETVGFLVRVSGNQVIIQFAKQISGYSVTSASVQPLKQAGDFEDGMKAFIQSFISG
ncbi:MAG: hypothetical protein Q8936_12485 [Bacillota bacterium]|nr:hypothetical protein [Bacillota bacterium]